MAVRLTRVKLPGRACASQARAGLLKSPFLGAALFGYRAEEVSRLKLIPASIPTLTGSANNNWAQSPRSGPGRIGQIG
jgi:hypothetical protein